MSSTSAAAAALTDDGGTLAVLSRLRALELQVGLLDAPSTAAEATAEEKDSSSCNPKDVLARLEALEHQSSNLWTTKSASLSSSSSSTSAVITAGMAWKETWLESDKLFEELDPATALTHQQGGKQAQMAPILYRRQAVLACADMLMENMKQVATILNLLLIGTSGNAAGGNGGNGGSTTLLNTTSGADKTGRSSKTNTATGTASQQQQQQQQAQNILSRSSITEEQVLQAPILLAANIDDSSNRDEERLAKVEEASLDLYRRVHQVAARLDRMLTTYHTLMATFSEQMVLLHEQVRQHEKTKA